MKQRRLVILLLVAGFFWVAWRRIDTHVGRLARSAEYAPFLGLRLRTLSLSRTWINRLSLNSGGEQANGDSFGGRVSADGRYAVFVSDASNLVADDTNNVRDVFLRDIDSGQTIRVSVNADGIQGNGDSSGGDISADGRFVVFSSNASNLVPGDSNTFCQASGIPGGSLNCPDVFVYDVLNDVVELISLSTGGMQGNGASYGGSISADGRFVAFGSRATNLVPGDTNDSCQANGAPGGNSNCPDAFVRDRLTGETTRISLDSNGNQANGATTATSLSASGRFAVLESYASNLVANDTNGYVDVFTHDRQTGATTIVSVSTAGVQGDFHSHDGEISGDGRYVVFQSLANLAPAGASWDIFLRDLATGVTSLISRQDLGHILHQSTAPSISYDGRFVALQAIHDNPAPPFPNDVFLLDRTSSQLSLITTSLDGTPTDNHSGFAHLSGDGRRLVFQSDVTDLVPADTNGNTDVFLARRSMGQARSAGTISVTGGQLVSFAYRTSLTFPTDTFTDTAVVTYTGYVPTAFPIPHPLAEIGHNFDIAAVYSGTGGIAIPMHPYTVTIDYSDHEVFGLQEETLSLHYWDGSQWIEAPGAVVDGPGNRLTTIVDRFSSWAVLGVTRRQYLPLIANPN